MIEKAFACVAAAVAVALVIIISVLVSKNDKLEQELIQVQSELSLKEQALIEQQKELHQMNMIKLELDRLKQKQDKVRNERIELIEQSHSDWLTCNVDTNLLRELFAEDCNAN